MCAQLVFFVCRKSDKRKNEENSNIIFIMPRDTFLTLFRIHYLNLTKNTYHRQKYMFPSKLFFKNLIK